MNTNLLFNEMDKYNSLNGRIKFEIYSWIGRTFFKHRSKIYLTTEPVLLDIGVGANYTPNWIHVDFFVFKNPFKSLFNKKILCKPEVEMDLRYPLVCPDNSVDGVFSSHTIEHLLPNETINLLSEIHRVLKPNKWLRVIVPDLQLAVDYYNGNNQLYEHATGCEAIMQLTQNSGHKSAWDGKLLSKILDKIGFVNIQRVDYGIGGQDNILIKEKDSRKFESLVIEAQKKNN